MKTLKTIFSLWILCFSMMSCKDKETQQDLLLRPVKYAEVNYQGGDKMRTFSGAAKTEKIINLSFRSSGIITVLDMKLGQVVKKGQLLSRLDNVQARLNYEAAIESKNSAESQMNTTKLNMDRLRKLYEKGSTSLSDYESAKNSYRNAVASFESSKRTVSIQEEQIRFGFLYAPENGVIASVSAEVDENVTSGQIIGVLNAGSAIEISLGLPESVINEVKKGSTVNVSFTAIPRESFNAVITEVAPALDRNTSTYPVTVTIADSDERIKSGMAANVSFEFEQKDRALRELIVPASAVGEDSNGRFVFLIEDTSEGAKVRKTTIEIGDLTPEGIEVKSGLSPGQKVATAGLQTLLDGQNVKLN